MSVVSFAAHFADLPDPRIARKRRHELLDIVVIALSAVICGAEGWDDIERFGLAKEGWFRERLGLGLPSAFLRMTPSAVSSRVWIPMPLPRASVGLWRLCGR